MSDTYLGTYDPTQVTIQLGPLNVSGFADGTFIKCAMMDPDLYKIHVGAHGEMARTKNPNKVGHITFTLKQTSPSNKYLDALKMSPTPFSVMVRDNSDSKMVAASANAWINKEPDRDRAAEEQNIEWLVTCDELLMSNI
jgi:hypothetical protein